MRSPRDHVIDYLYFVTIQNQLDGKCVVKLFLVGFMLKCMFIHFQVGLDKKSDNLFIVCTFNFCMHDHKS